MRLSAALCEQIIAAARAAEKPVYVDPARLPEWDKYRGAALITPNRAELEIALGRRVEARMQQAIDQMLARRRSLWRGSVFEPPNSYRFPSHATAAIGYTVAAAPSSKDNSSKDNVNPPKTSGLYS